MNLNKLRGLFTRRVLIHFAMSVAISALIGMAGDLIFQHRARMEASVLQTEAYASIAQFEPIGIAWKYFSILVMPDADDAQAMEWQRQQQVYKQFACEAAMNGSSRACAPPAPRFYLSAHVPLFLRPVTAFFDLVLHLFADNGWIGALVALVQIGLGILATILFGRLTHIGFKSFAGKLVGVPLVVMALGSAAAVPLWILSLLGVMLLKAVPMAAMGAQTGATAFMVSFFGKNAVEVLGHDVVMKQVERIVPK
jgi:hypothetical protein